MPLEPADSKAAAEADDLGIDRGAAAAGVLQLLDDQHAAALADDDAVALLVERPAGFFRSVVALRQMAEQALPDHAQRIELAVGAADEEEIGLVAANDAIRLAQGQQPGDVALGDRVVRPLSVVQDRDMAGEHVGQVLEHPQRRNARQALFAPGLQIDRRRLAIGAGLRCHADLRQFGRQQAGAELDAESGRIELVLVHMPIVESDLGGGHGQLDAAGHHVQAFAIGFLDEVLGIEIEDFAGDTRRQGRDVHALDELDAAASLKQAVPEARGIQAEGAYHSDACNDHTSIGNSHDAPESSR